MQLLSSEKIIEYHS
ncbi:hypothetical protein MXB_3850 [Myxobolus squamalis]|nr:hypothetical protein MXB_3850 [Myxobolus squamalis]